MSERKTRYCPVCNRRVLVGEPWKGMPTGIPDMHKHYGPRTVCRQELERIMGRQFGTTQEFVDAISREPR